MVSTADGFDYLFQEETALQIKGMTPVSDDKGLFSVYLVPLPASAPLFGAGLIALGAAGYAAKRKKAAVAA